MKGKENVRSYFKLYSNDKESIFLAKPQAQFPNVKYVQRLDKSPFASGLTQMIGVIGFNYEANATWGVINDSGVFTGAQLTGLQMAQLVFSIGNYPDHPIN